MNVIDKLKKADKKQIIVLYAFILLNLEILENKNVFIKQIVKQIENKYKILYKEDLNKSLDKMKGNDYVLDAELLKKDYVITYQVGEIWMELKTDLQWEEFKAFVIKKLTEIDKLNDM